MKYHVMCQKDNGVTGHNQALLKRDGMIVEFKTRKEAEEVARNMTIDMNHKFSVAEFTYWAVETG